jgi:hypothetical protein
MSAKLQLASSSNGPASIRNSHAGHILNCPRATQALVWVLISILLLLYLASSYVYWAKVETLPVFF